MHHEEIELNFVASCQQILGLESEILWEARSTPTLGYKPQMYHAYGTNYIQKTMYPGTFCTGVQTARRRPQTAKSSFLKNLLEILIQFMFYRTITKLCDGPEN
jgi:hypothetical protein